MLTITPTEMVAGLLVIALVVGIVAWLLVRRRRTGHLHDRFGPEYDRTVSRVGSTRKAEAELASREQRVARLQLRPLAPADRDRFVDAWQRIQAMFVDDPESAVTRADVLLTDVMGARGYPLGDFDQRAADLSVDHPEVIENYRRGHDIALRHSRGEAGTEDLRQAMIHYRALFDDLVNEPVDDREIDMRRPAHTR